MTSRPTHSAAGGPGDRRGRGGRGDPGDPGDPGGGATIEPFLLERFFAPHEFTARHVLCASGAETRTVGELCALEPGLESALLELSLGYSPSEGVPALRAAVAELYEGLAPEGVTVLPGGGPPLELCFRALLRPGDHLVTLTPCYQAYLSVPRHLGCEVSELALDEGPHGWRLDVDAVAQAMRPTTRALLVNFPNNPTGYQPGRATFDGLVELARRSGAYLISDDVFRFLEHDPALRLPAAPDVYERGISIGALSKSFGLPGLRIGWVASALPELGARLLRWNDYSAKDSSAPSQLLAAAALRRREALLAANRDLARRNLLLLEGFFTRHAESLAWSPPRAGVVGLARLARGSADELFEQLLRETGVLIAPGSLFGMPAASFRLGFGLRDFPAGLALFDEFLESRRRPISRRSAVERAFP